MSYNLLTVGHDAKTVKGETRGYLTGILYLAPSNLSGRNLCPNASPGCIATCLNTAGRGVFNSVQAGRIRKSHLLRDNRDEFMRLLVRDIVALVRRAERKGMVPVVRLNGTSDIPWENVGDSFNWPVMRKFPTVQFYDYTKSPARMLAFLAGTLPPNYHLTFSRSECNTDHSVNVLHRGGNVAVVFDTAKGQALPERWNGYKVLDGDTSDLRFLDHDGTTGIRPSGGPYYGLVVGLRAKGKARRDTSGFVVKVRPCITSASQSHDVTCRKDCANVNG